MEDRALAIKNDNTPVTFAEIQNIADAFVKSGMFADTKLQAQAIVKIIAGRELGLGPFYSMSRINMIQGKLGLAAETLGALIKRSGKYNYKVTFHDESKCSIEFFEDGKSVYNSTFTLEDAKKAELLKPNSSWAKYPRAMLFSRALSQGARIVAPDVIGGAYTDEELQSIPPKNGNNGSTVVTEIIEETEKPEAKPATPPADPSLATELQLKKLFASCKEKGYTEEAIHDILNTRYHKKSTRELTRKEASEFIDAVLDEKTFEMATGNWSK